MSQDTQESPEEVLDVDPGGDVALTGRTLSQKEDEKDDAYLCFLLWCMQTPVERSNRLIARSIGVPEPTVRYWKKRHKWKARAVVVQNVEFHALKAYRQRMSELPGEVQAARLGVALDAVLEEAGFATLRRQVQRQRAGMTSQLSGTAPKSEHQPAPVPVSQLVEQEMDHVDIARHLKDVREQTIRNHLRPEDVRRQVLLIDGVLGLIARKVQDGSIRVRVSDIPGLLKARALITGLPTEEHAAHTGSVDRSQHVHQHLHVVESVRMRDARKTGKSREVIEAMTAEVEDLQVILGAIPKEVDGE